MKESKVYAVAVRDSEKLFLVVGICRGPQGDVYVNWSGGGPHLEPHTSYHASGQTHHKTFDRKLHPGLTNQANLVRQRQPPDKNFVGTENIVTTKVSLHSARAFNQPCDSSEFAEVFEILGDQLNLGEGRMPLLSVDVTAPVKLPFIPTSVNPGDRLVLQHSCQDAIPWIMVTVLDVRS